jgi:RimJ/RimL family protein N-acetyltransferase
MHILETDRLIHRPLTLDDAEDLFRIYSDAETMTFMGRPPASVEFERQQIQTLIERHYKRHGFGVWATVLKENGELIGRCGLMRQEIGGSQEVEVAYLLERKYWGRGLATEAARGIVRFGFEQLQLPRIVAVINPRNVASIRVAEKIGMSYEREISYKDFGLVSLYALEASHVLTR